MLLRLVPLLVFALLCGLLWQSLAEKTPDSDHASLLLPLPDFDLPLVAGGGTLHAAKLKNKVAIINFFASWCVSCIEEHRILRDWKRNPDIPLYGIAWHDEAGKAKIWLDKHGNPYDAVGVDSAGETGIALGLRGVPETFVVNKQGMIIFKHTGPLSEEDIQHTINPLLEALNNDP